MVKVMGVDFDANKASFVVIEKSHDEVTVAFKERIQLGETRSRDEMVAFRDAVRRILSEGAPDSISIRSKPENGQMRAGPAALKMEAIILAESPVEVAFVSSVKANKQPEGDGLFAYLQSAYKAALAHMISPAKK